MNRRAFLSGAAALLAVPLGAEGQQGGPSPVGVDAIKRVLTGHRQWTLYWDPPPPTTTTSRPNAG